MTKKICQVLSSKLCLKSLSYKLLCGNCAVYFPQSPNNLPSLEALCFKALCISQIFIS